MCRIPCRRPAITTIAPGIGWPSRPGPRPISPARNSHWSPDRLAAKAGKPVALTISSSQITGAAGGEWCPYGLGGLGPELPTDQRTDDAWSLVFDGEVLSEPLEILGAPVLDLDIASDQPVATLVARLSDVAPDGKVTRVTYGVLNLTHRDSHESTRPLGAGQALQGEAAAERYRPSLPRRPSRAPRALHRLLADHLALAHARDGSPS